MSRANAASRRNMRGWRRSIGAIGSAASSCSASPATSSAHQEPGAAAEIKDFCTREYDVTFPMFAKTRVNGDDAHPLFAALKAEAKGVLGTQAIKWNFTKFLVDRSGKVVKRYAPTERPERLAKDIEATLG